MTLLILLHVAIQFKQHHLLKIMSFSSVYFWLNYHKSGRCAELCQGLQLHCIDARVCFMEIPCPFYYYSSLVQFEIRDGVMRSLELGLSSLIA